MRSETFFENFLKNGTNRTSVASVSAERGNELFSSLNTAGIGGEIMKPSSFETAIRLQFDCLAKRVVDTTIKDYNREMGRRANHEVTFSELSDLELNCMGTLDEYEVEHTCFEVIGMKVKVENEQLAKALKNLSDKKRDIILMFYFLEMSDAEIADLLQIGRNTSFRNRKSSLEEIKKMIEEG